MIQIDIPGRGSVEIKHVVLDYNGTIARDGDVLDGVKERIEALSDKVDVYILTADTYGTVRQKCKDLKAEVMTFPRDDAANYKRDIVKAFGGGVFTVGNGYNDILMSDEADMAIGVMEKEGICAQLISHVDVLVQSPVEAMDLLLLPNRLRADLRG